MMLLESDVIEQARAARLEAAEMRARAAEIRAAARATVRHARWRAIRGGDGALGSEGNIRVLLRGLISSGTLPAEPPTSIWAGPSPGKRHCKACDGTLLAGDMEYEMQGAGETIYMHVRCLELWAMLARAYSDKLVCTFCRRPIAPGAPKTENAGVSYHPGCWDRKLRQAKLQ